MADVRPDPIGEVRESAAGTGVRRFLTFRADDRLYALPAEEVSEIIRTPTVARLPQGPASLMGMANLRGAILPVASLRGLLGRDSGTSDASPRTIVLKGEAPVAIAVDGVEALVAVAEQHIAAGQAELAAEPGERLKGAFEAGPDSGVAKILDIQELLAAAFVQRPRLERAPRPDIGAAASHDERADAKSRQRIATFEVAGQEYALDLTEVREIISMPPSLASVGHGDAVVRGVSAYRDTLLPLLSLRGLLGLPRADASQQREKVVVTAVGALLAGLVVDAICAIITVDPDRLEPPPPILTARAAGEARLKAIYRHGDTRLISVLAPDQLFREDIVQRLGDGRASPRSDGETPVAEGVDDIQFLVFRLGGDEFGLPIEVVDEVARAPEQVTKVPKTPKFLEGVTNLRGEVLPVVDQRRRFDMAPLEGREGLRMVVVRSERHRAGLIVDSVSDVLRVRRDSIEPAPDLTGQPNRLVSGVVNLESAGRIVLVLDPAELLSRAERVLLDAFEPGAKLASE